LRGYGCLQWTDIHTRTNSATFKSEIVEELFVPASSSKPTGF
jgi:hypothetical protein